MSIACLKGDIKQTYNFILTLLCLLQKHEHFRNMSLVNIKK